jgi:hypothetical protein
MRFVTEHVTGRSVVSTLADGAHARQSARVTDEHGYLMATGSRARLGRQEDGVLRTVFRRDHLESALRSYGEDECADAVRAGLTPQKVYEIGIAHYRLSYTPDPDKTSGAGYAFDKALALAAVEVLEGFPRQLKRKRRRPQL